MANNELIPDIRFVGFSEPWEQRRLSDVSDVRDGTHDSPPYQSEGHPFVTSKNVKDGYINYDDIQFISDEYFEAINRRSKVDVNDILMGMIGTIGNLALIRTEPDFAIKNVALIKDTKQVSYLYLYSYLQSPNTERQLISGLDGGTQKFVSLKKIRELNILVPSEEEQIKVGTFIESLDNLITLHQRKLEKLQAIKRSMLEKMFPRDGSSFPEIRFAGFTDPWEQRKFGDVFEEYSEKKHDELPPLTIIQGRGTIPRELSDRNLQYDKSNLAGYKMVKKGDFIVHLRSFEGGLEKANTNGIISPAYHTFHGINTDTRFYYPFFRSRWFIDILLKPHVYGIRDGRSINIEGMKTILIPVPNYEEQKIIGDLIEGLDTLINLYHRKLKLLQAIKRSMLEKMFV